MESCKLKLMWGASHINQSNQLAISFSNNLLAWYQIYFSTLLTSSLSKAIILPATMLEHLNWCCYSNHVHPKVFVHQSHMNPFAQTISNWNLSKSSKLLKGQGLFSGVLDRYNIFLLLLLVHIIIKGKKTW